MASDWTHWSAQLRRRHAAQIAGRSSARRVVLCSVCNRRSSADSRAMILPVDPDAAGRRRPPAASAPSPSRSPTTAASASRADVSRDMDDDHGMLFVFEDQREVGFWMKNTPMPLDLVFIGQDGTIRDDPAGRAVLGGADLAGRAGALRAGAQGAAPPRRHGIEPTATRSRHPAIDQTPAPAGRGSRLNGLDTEGNRRRDAVLHAMTASTSPSSTSSRRRTRRAGAADPRLCLEPYGQLGVARLGEDAERRRLPRDRLRQSRPWRDRRRATIRPTIRPRRWPATPRRCSAISASSAPMSWAIRWARASPPSWRSPSRRQVATLVFGGLGIGMVDGVGDWDPIAAALLADDPASDHPSARQGRSAPSPTRRKATARRSPPASRRRANCSARTRSRASRSRRWLPSAPRTTSAARPRRWPALMPNAVAFAIEGRDHMLAVGDRTFKKRALEFLAAHPVKLMKCCAA